jgi:hypothetical protein
MSRNNSSCSGQEVLSKYTRSSHATPSQVMLPTTQSISKEPTMAPSTSSNTKQPNRTFGTLKLKPLRKNVVIMVCVLGFLYSLVSNSYSSMLAYSSMPAYVPESQFIPKTTTPKTTAFVNTTSQMLAEEITAATPSPGECAIREIPKTNVSEWHLPPGPRGRKDSAWDQCLRFECQKHSPACDSMDQTSYEGDQPPCCSHVLRDMAKAFDDVMCELGLEYFAAYGTLLGLLRSDKLIPWTIDNDYLVTKDTLSVLFNLTPAHYNATFGKHGLSFFQDRLLRLCVTPDFVTGKLARWRSKKSGYYPLILPYSDLFVADVDETGMLWDELGCFHPVDDIRPARRQSAYNGTLHVWVPNNGAAVIERVYGRNWRKPDAKKSEHGNTNCDRHRKPPNATFINRQKFLGG